MGCCGHDFISKDKIEEAVHKNTQEFQTSNPQTESDFLIFRDRRPAMDLRNGVCRNLIEVQGRLLCPLHPTRHKGKDLREGHCEVDYFCKTAKLFPKWDKEKQDRFIAFIEAKKLDNITYSMKMDKGELLKEFEGQTGK